MNHIYIFANHIFIYMNSIWTYVHSLLESDAPWACLYILEMPRVAYAFVGKSKRLFLRLLSRSFPFLFSLRNLEAENRIVIASDWGKGKWQVAFFKKRFYVFIWERERERAQVPGRGMQRQRGEADSLLSRETHVGLNSKMLGSWPKPKPDSLTIGTWTSCFSIGAKFLLCKMSKF